MSEVDWKLDETHKLGLNIGTYNALRRNGIYTIEELEQSMPMLNRFSYIGVVRAKEITQSLKAYKEKLEMSEKDWDEVPEPEFDVMLRKHRAEKSIVNTNKFLSLLMECSHEDMVVFKGFLDLVLKAGKRG